MTWKPMVASLFAILLIAGCSSDDGGTGPTGAGPAGKLYVLNQGAGTIYIYDTKTLARIDTVVSPVDLPHYIEFSPDGLNYYVTTLETSGHFAKFDRATNDIVSSVAVPPSVRPSAIAITADSKYGYICNFSRTTEKTFIHKYDLTTMTKVKELQAGATTHDLKITSDGATVVACNRFTNDLTTIQTADDDVNFIGIDPDETYPIGHSVYGPLGVVIDHKDSIAYIACMDMNQVRYFDIASETIVDSITLPVDGPSSKAGPTLLAVSPDNRAVYVTTQAGNSVVAFDPVTKTILANIKFETKLSFGITMSDDGSRVYVACIGGEFPGDHGRVYILDGNTQTKIDSIDVGYQSYGLKWQSE